MKKKLAGALFLVTAAFIVGSEFRYPSEWDQIERGMSREQVLEKIGDPTYDWKEIKGAFWTKRGLFTTHEMNVYFESKTATSVYLERRIGTNEHFYKQLLRMDFEPH